MGGVPEQNLRSASSVVVGFILGNGERLADAVSLTFQAPGKAEVETYTYSHPRHPGVAGRVDPWLVEVPARGLASLDLDAQHFLSPRTGRRFSTWERGEVSVRLRGLGHTPWPGLRGLGRQWTGVVDSDLFHVPKSCHGGSPAPAPDGGRVEILWLFRRHPKELHCNH